MYSFSAVDGAARDRHVEYGSLPHVGLTCKHNGKTRSVYVPKDLLPEVRSWLAEHKRIKQRLQEIHQLSMALVQTHARHRQHKAGRP